MLRASILVVEYGTRDDLRACLASLRATEMPAEDYEVIVVDNGSPTPARALADAFAPNVRLIETGRNLGFAGACQVGLAQARGEAIALLNPDCEVDPGWLPNVIRPLSDPAVGVVGSKIYYHGTRILQHAGAVLAENAVSAHRGRGEEDAGQYDEATDVDYVTGAAMAVARRTIERERVGFLSTAYHPVYYEDSELCLRARRAGFRVVYNPAAVAYHREAVASGGVSPTFLSRYHASRVRFVLRNYSPADIVRRFVPAEIAFLLAPARTSLERRIALSSYLRVALGARKGD